MKPQNFSQVSNPKRNSVLAFITPNINDSAYLDDQIHRILYFGKSTADFKKLYKCGGQSPTIVIHWMGGGLSIVPLKLLSNWTVGNLCFGFVCVRLFLLWSLSIVLGKFIELRKDSGVNRYRK